MLIDSKGIKHGIISTKDALKIANDESLDLVQVSPNNAEPVVCKLLDYGKRCLIRRKAFLHQKHEQKNTQQKKLSSDRLLT